MKYEDWIRDYNERVLKAFDELEDVIKKLKSLKSEKRRVLRKHFKGFIVNRDELKEEVLNVIKKELNNHGEVIK